LFLAAAPEELLQQSGTVVGEDAAANGEAVVERRRRYVDDGAAAAGFRVRGAEDDAAQARQDRGERAHGARLERYVKRATVQPPVAYGAAGFSYGFEFGVRYGLTRGFGPVSATRYNAAVGYDYGPHRNFAVGPGLFGRCEGFPHKPFVFFFLGHSVAVSFAFDYGEII
jgi:hypothetical protein